MSSTANALPSPGNAPAGGPVRRAPETGFVFSELLRHVHSASHETAG
jgi:hypothetical protein